MMLAENELPLFERPAAATDWRRVWMCTYGPLLVSLSLILRQAGGVRLVRAVSESAQIHRQTSTHTGVLLGYSVLPISFMEIKPGSLMKTLCCTQVLSSASTELIQSLCLLNDFLNLAFSLFLLALITAFINV